MPPETEIVKRVVLTGPESVGKSFLANALADHYHTQYVEEYGRSYVEKFGTDFDLLDISHIAAGQLLYEDAAAEKANGYLFCDTDLILTKVWSEFVLDTCPHWIDQMIECRDYDLWLLLDTDWTWHEDGTRKFPGIREDMFHRIKEILESLNRPFAIIQGSGTERFYCALKAVEAID